MILTDWHHLFGMTLTDYFSGTSYKVELEKELSLKKQRLDVVIIDEQDGKPPDELPDGLDNLSAHNLLSYKSLHEPFDDWAADELIGHFVNYRKQISPCLDKLLPKADFRLYAVCTRYPRKLANCVTLRQHEKGIYDFRWGGRRDIRLIVTSLVALKKRNALWLMFGTVQKNIKFGVACYKGKMDEMSSAINQLLVKYNTEGIIAMPYTVEDYRKELKENVLNSLTLDEILEKYSRDEILEKYSRDEILEKYSRDEILEKYSRDEILEKYSPDEIKAYLEKLTKRPEHRMKSRSKAD